MKKNKFIAATLSFSLSLGTFFVPQKSQAIIGTGGAGAVLIGGAGGFVGAIGLMLAGSNRNKFIYELGEALLYYSSYAIFTGIILLDDNGSQNVAFAELTKDAAKKLQIPEASRVAYNSELPEINAVLGTIGGEVTQASQNGQPVTVEDVHSKWQSYQDRFSPEAFMALQKVSESFAAQISAQH